MKRAVFLAAFLFTLTSYAQLTFNAEFNFSDTTLTNQSVAVNVSGVWDSLAGPANSGPYLQTISTNTTVGGYATTSVAVPALVNNVVVSYSYTNCYGVLYTRQSSSSISSSTVLVQDSAEFCPTLNCTSNITVAPDTTSLGGLNIFGANLNVANSPGGTVSYSWWLSDNSSYTTQYFTHTFAQPGTYTVIGDILITTPGNTYPCRSSDTVLITVPQLFCDADFLTTANGLNVNFRANVNAGTHYYSLDGVTYSSANFSHTFSAPGTYPVFAKHNVTNANGSCGDSLVKNITVTNAGPSLFQIEGALNNISPNDTAEVYLIKSYLDSTTNNTILSLVQSVITDSGGYALRSVPAGTYYIKAALTSGSPSYSGTLPTYFGDELMWSNATSILVGPSQYNANISLILGSNLGGPSFISGIVQQGANKVMAGGPWDVFLTTDQDVPVAYQRTDGNNSYNFSNLTYGTYKVFVEIPGSIVSPHIITLSGTNSGATNINFGADSVATGPLSLSADALLGATLFPNPAKDIVSLEVNTTSAEAIFVTVYAANGAEVLTETMKNGKNNKTLTLNVKQWEQGLYIVKIAQGDTVSFKKLQKL